MIDRRLLRDFDWVMLGLTLALAGAGAVGVYSATHPEGGGASPMFVDHVGRIALGFAALLVATAVDYRVVLHWAWHGYALALAALVAVDIFGMVGMGAQRWLSLGFVSIQPSEFFKLALVLVLARYFGGLKKPSPFSPGDLWPVALAAAVPFLLVLKQPDLGTALIIAGIFTAMLFVAGAETRLFGTAGAAAAGIGAVLAILGKLGIFNPLGMLREYQVRRIKVLFNPELDPLGAGYHISQSKIAIGSGGLAGKGYLQGTQSGLKFLPQQHTDFIFSVIAEEWGFAGSVVVILLMVGLILWAVQTAYRARDFAGSLLAMGVATVFALHCAVNIGMTTGIFPVVGIPLPLLSYGGSSVLVTFTGIGLVMNVKMRRFVYG
ncbi:MAG TPA: rod shape-determining protein RodA [Candidatus Methanoperedens sp.]|nr:rod shape-determining protein RodA [Candidatus Methanoperedens sp.]